MKLSIEFSTGSALSLSIKSSEESRNQHLSQRPPDPPSHDHSLSNSPALASRTRGSISLQTPNSAPNSSLTQARQARQAGKHWQVCPRDLTAKPPHPRPANQSTIMARSDQALANKWDIAISNGLVKTGLGFGVGVITSVLFFRRRAFPVLLGTGFGAGKAWAEGDALFRLNSLPDAGKRDVKA